MSDLFSFFGTDVIVPGDLLGRVRVWVPDETGGINHRLIENAADGGTMMDPGPAICGSDGRELLLFVLGTCKHGNAMCGVWQSAAYRSIRFLPWLYDAGAGSYVLTEAGRDFVVSGAWNTSGFESDDLVVGMENGLYLDPDPVHTAYGWWVYPGAGPHVFSNYDAGAVWRFASKEDICDRARSTSP